jgi:hypothetical protein
MMNTVTECINIRLVKWLIYHNQQVLQFVPCYGMMHPIDIAAAAAGNHDGNQLTRDMI